ncbi:MAG: TetR/AcrR family transcriptional regulator [Nitrospinota bacterium]|nr:TetR/AcrR family transcriptional regulator [Nitrospinota bacterium]
MAMKQTHRSHRTKQKLLDLSLRMVLERGYHATSLNQICDGAGVTKGGLFHHFPDKEALAVAMLDRFWDGRKELLDSLRDSQKDPLEKLMCHMEFVYQLPKHERKYIGCLMGVLAQELSLSNANLRKAVSKKFSEWREIIRQDIRGAAEAYCPGKQMDVESLADYLLAVFEGSLLMARADGNGKIIRGNAAYLKRNLESIFIDNT